MTPITAAQAIAGETLINQGGTLYTVVKTVKKRDGRIGLFLTVGHEKSAGKLVVYPSTWKATAVLPFERVS